MALWKRIAHIETDFSEPDLPPLLSKAEGDERCGNRYCQVSMQLLSALGLKKATVLPRCNSCASFSSRNRATKQKGERPANQCHSTILGYFARLGPGDELHEALKDEVDQRKKLFPVDAQATSTRRRAYGAVVLEVASVSGHSDAAPPTPDARQRRAETRKRRQQASSGEAGTPPTTPALPAKGAKRRKLSIPRRAHFW